MGAAALLILAIASGNSLTLGELLEKGVRLGVGGRLTLEGEATVQRLDKDEYVICYKRAKERICVEGTEMQLRKRATREAEEDKALKAAVM